MHNLAIALHRKGELVSGSDDEIFEPSRSRLLKEGLLPAETGWFPEKINKELDAVILGMHAKADNPELIEAQGLGLRIFSYPEYLYEQSKHKKTCSHRRKPRQNNDYCHDFARIAACRHRLRLYGWRSAGRL